MILSQMQPLKAMGNKFKIGGGAWVREIARRIFNSFVSMGLLISTFVVKNSACIYARSQSGLRGKSKLSH